jgi:CheY-like chemotaxis protein
MSALQHKVLVVDDAPVVATSFNRVRSQKGYVVVTAENAQEALSKVQEGEYDVVFTDIKMPGMSGIEVAERVRANQPWLPVVIITGYGTEENEARAEAAGVSAFLSKPLSPEMIMGTTEMTLAATPADVAAIAALFARVRAAAHRAGRPARRRIQRCHVRCARAAVGSGLRGRRGQ